MVRLFTNLEKYRKRIALIGPDEKTYSYNEILKQVEYLNSKIEKRSLILILASNNVQSIIGYISFIRSNNISILLDKSFKIEYVKKIIKRYKPNYIFIPKDYNHIIKKNYTIIPFKDYNLVKTNFKKQKNINKKNTLLLSTSGTTQNPKFVRLSNLNLLHNTKSIIKYLKINSNHTTITTMPMGYSYGLSIINTHLTTGSKIIINNRSTIERKFWDNVIKYKVTSFGGVPQLYEQLKKIKFENFNLNNLKYLTQAVGKLDEGYLKYFGYVCKKNKIKFFVMYGQTEASPRMSYLDWSKFYLNFGSVGKPLPNSKFILLNHKGKRIKKPFITGELVYFGKNVSLGYARNVEDLKKGDENKGILYTGDLGFKDKDNYYYITGRTNRILKIFGTRLDLDDIEKKLKKDNYKIKCINDNKYLKILIDDNYNKEEIKKKIYDYFGINKNYIFISKIEKYYNQKSFKETI